MAGVHRGGGGGKGHGHPPAGGPPPPDSSAFFASLHRDELTPLEAALRQVLLDWVVSLGHQPFPLTEWIDRRVGGEIETRRSEDGHFFLAMRGQAPPPPGHHGGHFAPPPGNFGRAPPPAPGYHMQGAYPPPAPPPGANAAPPPPAPDRNKGSGKGAEAFFRGLPNDSFSRPEEELRDAIFDFLASWKSQALANIGDVGQDPNIKKVMARLMPKEVRLGDWIEKRIGGEITLKQEGPGQPIIHLTKPAQAIVADKYKAAQAIEAAKAGGQAQKGASGARGAPDADFGPRPKAGAKSAPAPGGDSRSAEDFFKTLPTDELLEEELALRDAVLEFLNRWPSQRPDKPVPNLADVGQDPAIMRAKTILPQKVSIRDWIERRIGGEIAVDRDSKGQYEIYLRGAKPAAPKGRGEREKGNGRSPAESAEAFFATLPDDSLTDQEADLRLAVLDFLDTMNGTPVSLQDSSKDRAIQSASSALLPQEVNLRQWINRRVGGEVRIEKDSKGGQWVMSKATADSAPAQSGSDKKEAFFATLPEDSFTPEEEDLRDTLLAFLGQWKGSDPPSISDAGGDVEVRRARPAALPKGCQVSLKDWVERRIGGEIEVAMDPRGSGQYLFGLRGALDLPPASRGQQGGGATKKRRM